MTPENCNLKWDVLKVTERSSSSTSLRWTKCANTKSSEMEGTGNNVQKCGTTGKFPFALSFGFIIVQGQGTNEMAKLILSVAFASLNADTVGFFYSIANRMTEFLLVAENVTETEDADFVLYFRENFFLFQIMQIGPGLILCDLHSQGLSWQLNSLFRFDWN
jgi:hypothetical protein